MGGPIVGVISGLAARTTTRGKVGLIVSGFMVLALAALTVVGMVFGHRSGEP
jgi:hypothetical protein